MGRSRGVSSRRDVVPTLAEALLGAGLDAIKRRQFGEAIADFQEYVRLQPANVRGYLELARAFLGNGAYGDALRTIVEGFTHATGAGARQQLTQALLDGGMQALSAGDVRSGISWLQEYVSDVNAVTAADVQRVARRYVPDDAATIIVVGDLAQVRAGIEALNLGPVSVVTVEELTRP